MHFELKTDVFRGPIETLLELIEKEKLDITELSLAEVTDAFLKHLENLRKELESENKQPSSPATHKRLALISGFLVVASRLILLKSRTLLPHLSLSEEEQEDIEDLKRRLELYKRFKKAEINIENLWDRGEVSLSRPYFLDSRGVEGVFYPDDNLTQEKLHGSIDNLLRLLERFTKEEESLESTLVSLEEKIAEVRQRIKHVAEESLQALSRGATKAEAVALFLAALHLAREQLVFLEQGEHFSDIIIKKQR